MGEGSKHEGHFHRGGGEPLPKLVHEEVTRQMYLVVKTINKPKKTSTKTTIRVKTYSTEQYFCIHNETSHCMLNFRKNGLRKIQKWLSVTPYTTELFWVKGAIKQYNFFPHFFFCILHYSTLSDRKQNFRIFT